MARFAFCSLSVLEAGALRARRPPVVGAVSSSIAAASSDFSSSDFASSDFASSSFSSASASAASFSPSVSAASSSSSSESENNPVAFSAAFSCAVFGPGVPVSIANGANTSSSSESTYSFAFAFFFPFLFPSPPPPGRLLSSSNIRSPALRAMYSWLFRLNLSLAAAAAASSAFRFSSKSALTFALPIASFVISACLSAMSDSRFAWNAASSAAARSRCGAFSLSCFWQNCTCCRTRFLSNPRFADATAATLRFSTSSPPPLVASTAVAATMSCSNKVRARVRFSSATLTCAAFVPPSSAAAPPAIFCPARSVCCTDRHALSCNTYARLNRRRWFQGATRNARRKTAVAARKSFASYQFLAW
mmetsp:Transcript_3300/g.12307  ORF Transcript_3300/g.12307 Transcript_3300/m.12307 type:complete len:362 (+) Transcript_3300:194-1279(+)